MRTLILGIGNPECTDDKVGSAVVSQVPRSLLSKGVTVAETDLNGLNLLHLVTGHDRVIIVGAIQTADGRAGDVYRLTWPDMTGTSHVLSHRWIDFFKLLSLSNELDLVMPREILILCVEAADLTSIGEECTPEVKRAIPVVTQMVTRELEYALLLSS